MRENLCKLFFVLLIGLFMCYPQSFLFGQKHPSELKSPRKIKFTPPKPEKIDVGKGMTVYFLEDRELPIVSMMGYFKGGSFRVPLSKIGLAQLTAIVMRTGGTARMSGDEINEELEFLAEDISVGFTNEYFVTGFSCLKKNLPRIFEIYSDIITSPVFNQEKIDLSKKQLKQSIKTRWNRIGNIGPQLFTIFLNGADSPNVRRPTFKSLDSISREDLVQFHKKYFMPNNMYIAITGDMSASEIKTLLGKAFINWNPRPLDLPEVPKVEDKSTMKIYYVPKEGPQAHIAIGHFSELHVDHPDIEKIQVLNRVLGYGMTSRLNKELRVKRGYTYGISGGLTIGKENGSFRIGSALKAEKLGESLVVIKDILKTMQKELVTDEEIERAKNSLINISVFKYQSKMAIISGQIVREEIMNRPKFDESERLEKIRLVTKEDLLKMAKKYIRPDKLMMVIVGDKKRFDQPLEELGVVEEINLEDLKRKDLGKEEVKK
jgi:predicted Zn-dependent peptidase